MASAFVPFFIFYLKYFIVYSKKYDNASDEINYRILTLIQNAEKVYNSGVYNDIGRFQILCELPHNGDAVLVNQKDEVYGIRDTVISNIDNCSLREPLAVSRPWMRNRSSLRRTAANALVPLSSLPYPLVSQRSKATDSSSRISQKTNNKAQSVYGRLR